MQNITTVIKIKISFSYDNFYFLVQYSLPDIILYGTKVLFLVAGNAYNDQMFSYIVQSINEKKPISFMVTFCLACVWFKSNIVHKEVKQMTKSVKHTSEIIIIVNCNFVVPGLVLPFFFDDPVSYANVLHLLLKVGLKFPPDIGFPPLPPYA